MEVDIVRADAAEAGMVADLIGEAFLRLEPSQWLVPDMDERARVLPANFRIYVDLAMDHGEVHVTADRSGAAVWFPRDRPLPEPEDYESRLAAACGKWVDRFRVLDALFAAHHPSQPHHHLAHLAVRPERHGQGIGSALLRHHHAFLDRHGMAAYLEASDPRSRDLYLRHGYEPRGEPFTVPSGAPFWPMWRPAER